MIGMNLKRIRPVYKSRALRLLIVMATVSVAGCELGLQNNDSEMKDPNPVTAKPSSPAQVVFGPQTKQKVAVGDRLRLPIQYKVEPNPTSLAGLGLRVHWSSSELEYKWLGTQYAEGLLGRGAVQSDIDDLDGNIHTDRFVVIAWADMPEGKWPADASQPIRLFNAVFDGKAAGATTVSFSSSATVQDYPLNATPITVIVE